MASTRIVDHLGRVLGSRYRLIAPIGTGASAHVFLADDVRLRRRVAVKVLHPALADDANFLRRFRAEAQVVAALNHPHLLAVYDWGEEADGPYIVTEFLGGGSLRSLLDRGHRLTVAQALLVGLEAARGLDYAHRRGLVHRDIKPANLLFDDDGRLRIADFGVARALAEAAWTEPAGAVLGTARDVSPEQVQSAPLDGKSDVYSLALVLVESVTGKVPFAGDTTIATLMARVQNTLDPPAELGPLGPVVVQAAQPEPSARPDAVGLAAALQKVANDLDSPAPLPLVGPAIDDNLVVQADEPTDLGGGGNTKRTAAAMAGGRLAGSVTPGATDTATETASDTASDTATGGSNSLYDQGAVATQPVSVVSPVATKARSDKAPTTVEPIPLARRRRRRWPYVLLALLVLLGGGGAGAWALARSQVPSHPVPNVVTQPEADAVAALVALEFEPRLVREFVDGTEAGKVTAQAPAGGELKEGKTVTLTISRGPTPVAIPDLSGTPTDAEATQALGAVGLQVGEVTRQHHEEVAAGRVLDWAPKGGEQPKGSTVNLVLSAGPAPRTVPEVAGQSYDAAAAAVRAKGLEIGRNDTFSDTVPEGTVISSNPGSGTSVPRGSRVTVTVSRGLPSVPDLKGSTADSAKAKLEAVGFKLGNVYGPAGGTVFLQSVNAGTRAKSGTTVNVYVS